MFGVVLRMAVAPEAHRSRSLQDRSPPVITGFVVPAGHKAETVCANDGYPLIVQIVCLILVGFIWSISDFN